MAERSDGEINLGGYAATCKLCGWYYSNSDENLPEDIRRRDVIVVTNRHNYDKHPNLQPSVSIKNL